MKNEMFVTRTHIANRGFAPMTDQYLRAFRYLGAFPLKSDDSLISGRSRESEEKARSGEREPLDRMRRLSILQSTICSLKSAIGKKFTLTGARRVGNSHS